MKIGNPPPLNSPGPTPRRGAVAPPSSGPADHTAEVELAAGRHHTPLRDSEQFPEWLQHYERDLRLSPEALEMRRKALHKGGAAMLYRMFPLRFQEDLRGPYADAARLLPKAGPVVTLAGDGHLGNFGTLRHGDGPVLWTLNDYDQVASGPVESDLCRAGASLALLCREKGWDKQDFSAILRAFLDGYQGGLSARRGVLGLSRKEASEPVAGLIKKADKRTQEELLSRYTTLESGGLRFQRNDSLHPLQAEQQQRLDDLLQRADWKGVQVLDTAVRTDAGGSSLGLERYYVLARRGNQGLARIIEVKQVLPCALTCSTADPREADPDLLRDGYTLLHAPKDEWLKVLPADNGVYLIRERQRARDSLDVEKLGRHEARRLAEQMGLVLGEAHGGSAREIRAWLEGRQEQLAERLEDFSLSYASQMAQDFQAVKSGRRPPA